MHDLFLVSSRHDSETALNFAARLGGLGLELGATVWLANRPSGQVLRTVDRGLEDSRFALVLLTRQFLGGPAAHELDGLANRRRVVSVLYGVDERDVAERSTRLAVAALPGSLTDQLVRLIKNSRE